jgi:hypothetical protein
MRLGGLLLKTAAARGFVNQEFTPAAMERSSLDTVSSLLPGKSDEYSSGSQPMLSPPDAPSASRPAYLDARPAARASTIPTGQDLASQTRGGKTPISHGLFQFNSKANPNIKVDPNDIEGQFKAMGELSGGGKNWRPWATTHARLDASGPVRMHLSKEVGGGYQSFAPIKSLSGDQLRQAIEKKHGAGSYDQWAGYAKKYAPHADPNYVLNVAGAESAFNAGAQGDWVS